MKHIVNILVLLLWAASFSTAQNQPVEPGTHPASTNINKNGYPRITSDLRVIFRVNAPTAQKVQIDLGKMYDMQRDAQGVWTVTTEPQVAGFHYYNLVVDGVSVADPASDSFFGVSRMSSGIEIPESGVDFYSVNNVPHGQVSSKWYFSKTTQAWRKFYIYLPPGYDTNLTKKYPVLYLQHGGGEDETGWVKQGRVDIILDNLIAEGKAVAMLIVMENSNAAKPGETGRMNMGGAPGSNQWMAGPSTFKEVLLNDLIPFVDNTFRTITDREHRAMAGLSMGGFLTVNTVFEHPETFGYLGAFSGGMRLTPEDDLKTLYNGTLNDPATFNKKFKVFFQSIGTAEGPWLRVKQTNEILTKKGINNIYYESPGTAHEWLTWRRSLNEFAPLLFK
jgi:enterochelin esterase family protein